MGVSALPFQEDRLASQQTVQQGQESPGAAAIADSLAAIGLADSSRVADRLWAFHSLLRDADQELNLTRLRSFAAIVEKHYVDSLLPLVLAPFTGRVMDLGSGGGFPGIPLALARPDLRFVLVEGRRRRTAFLQAAVDELGATNVEVVSRKLNPFDEVPVDTVVVRAVARAEDLLNRVARSLRVGGLAILMKGPDCDDEIVAVASTNLPFELVDDVRYELPISADRRRLLVWRRLEGTWPLSAEVLPANEPVWWTEARVVESTSNANLKRWRQLLTGRGARKHGETLIAGARYARELLDEVSDDVLGVIFRGDEQALDSDPRVPCFRLSPLLFDELDTEGTSGPILWLRTPSILPWSGPAAGRLSLLVAMQNPENVGATLRSAEALGADEVVLLDGAASPFQPKALRAAGPSPWRMPLFRGPSLAEVHTLAPDAWALDAAGEDLQRREDVPTAMIVGREGGGVSDVDGSVARVAIVMAGRAESLNAAVAAAVALYAVSLRRSQ